MKDGSEPSSTAARRTCRFYIQNRSHVQVNYTVSQKNCAKLFLPELRQISTNFDNFWQKDGKEAKISQDIHKGLNKSEIILFHM